MSKVPVLFIIFNRPETAVESFRAIESYRPDELFIYADGPRADHPGDEELCMLTRAAITNQINWECNVHTMFQNKNSGCDISVPSAIDWMFQSVEWGIIIEDDCVIHKDFFAFCELALPRFLKVSKVMYISAFNPTPDLKKSSEAGFSNECRIWGWATWKRAWNCMDIQALKWKTFNKLLLFKEFGFFHGAMTWWYWQKAFGTEHDPWDNRWHFSVLSNNGLSLQSYVNLARNTGTTINGTHYSSNDIDPYRKIPFGSISWPISFPDKIRPSTDKKFNDIIEFYRIRLIGLWKKIKRGVIR